MLPPKTICAILEQRKLGHSYEKLAQQHGISYRTVYSICKGLTRVSSRALELAKKRRKPLKQIQKTLEQEAKVRRRGK